MTDYTGYIPEDNGHPKHGVILRSACLTYLETLKYQKTFTLKSLRVTLIVWKGRLALTQDKSHILTALSLKKNTENFQRRARIVSLCCARVCTCVLTLCPFTLLVPRCALNHLIRQLRYTICGHTQTHTRKNIYFFFFLMLNRSTLSQSPGISSTQSPYSC